MRLRSQRAQLPPAREELPVFEEETLSAVRSENTHFLLLLRY